MAHRWACQASLLPAFIRGRFTARDRHGGLLSATDDPGGVAHVNGSSSQDLALFSFMATQASGLSFGGVDAIVRYERPGGVDSQEYQDGRLVRWTPGPLAEVGVPVISLSTHLPGIRFPSADRALDATAWCFGWGDGEPDLCPPLGAPPVPDEGDGWPGASAVVGVVVHGTPLGSLSARWTIVDGLLRESTLMTTEGCDLILELPLVALTDSSSPIDTFSHPGCTVHGPSELAMMVGGLFELTEGAMGHRTGPARAAALLAELASDGGLAQLDTWARQTGQTAP